MIPPKKATMGLKKYKLGNIISKVAVAKLEPLDIPKILASAIGFFKITWNKTPETERDAPPNIHKNILGKRML